jgi:hypothetical protein
LPRRTSERQVPGNELQPLFGSPSAVAHSRQLPSWLQINVAILETPVIEKILTHLGLQAGAPPRARARAPQL